MKKKNEFNIMLFVFIIILIMILSCTKNDKKYPRGILLKTDNDFSAMSVKEGMEKAFLYYISDSGVMLRNNAYPVRSRNELVSLFEKSSDNICGFDRLVQSNSACGLLKKFNPSCNHSSFLIAEALQFS